MAVPARDTSMPGAARARRGIRMFAPLALSFALGACGFHLQGVAKLPPVLGRTYVDTGDRYTDFHQSLAEALDEPHPHRCPSFL